MASTNSSAKGMSPKEFQAICLEKGRYKIWPAMMHACADLDTADREVLDLGEHFGHKIIKNQTRGLYITKKKIEGLGLKTNNFLVFSLEWPKNRATGEKATAMFDIMCFPLEGTIVVDFANHDLTANNPASTMNRAAIDDFEVSDDDPMNIDDEPSTNKEVSIDGKASIGDAASANVAKPTLCPIKLSQIKRACWRIACQQNGVDESILKQVIHHDVVSEGSPELFRRLTDKDYIENSLLDHWKFDEHHSERPIAYHPHEDEFMSILGSRNCPSIAYMCMESPNALQGKYIQEIQLQWEGSQKVGGFNLICLLGSGASSFDVHYDPDTYDHDGPQHWVLNGLTGELMKMVKRPREVLEVDPQWRWGGQLPRKHVDCPACGKPVELCRTCHVQRGPCTECGEPGHA